MWFFFDFEFLGLENLKFFVGYKIKERFVGCWSKWVKSFIMQSLILFQWCLGFWDLLCKKVEETE